MRITRFEHEIDSQRQTTEVALDEWAQSQGGVLATHGIEPCIVVASFDAVARVGFLGHFAIDMSMPKQPAVASFATTLRNYNPTNGYESWMSGASQYSGDEQTQETMAIYRELLSKGKEDMVQVVQSVHSPVTIATWLGVNERINSVYFDTAAGTIDYSVSPIDQ